MKERQDRRFWLMQRGKWNKKERHTDLSLIMGSDGLIDGDYMGSAEFEWGAVPAAAAIMMDEYPEYDLFKTDITHYNGFDKLLVWCRSDWKDIIVQELERYCEECYGLKEHTGLADLTAQLTKAEILERKKDVRDGLARREFEFWWEIQHDWNFMCFFSGGSRRSSFEETIANAYNEWWMKLPREERAERLTQARKRMRV